jgi:hypothetical protein
MASDWWTPPLVPGNAGVWKRSFDTAEAKVTRICGTSVRVFVDNIEPGVISVHSSAFKSMAWAVK